METYLKGTLSLKLDNGECRTRWETRIAYFDQNAIQLEINNKIIKDSDVLKIFRSDTYLRNF